MYMLLPRDRIADTVKIVIRFILLFLVFAPLCSFDFDFNEMFERTIISEDEITAQNHIADDLLLNETKTAVVEQVKAILDLYYQGEYKIDVDADILSEQCIQIKQIRISLFSECENITGLQKVMEENFAECQLVVLQEVKNESK